MNMSAVEHYLNKNYGQYVLILESELGNSSLTSSEQGVLHSNIALAQLHLGLNRKAIKSTQACIDLYDNGPEKHLIRGTYIRACITKAKAYLASSKPVEAFQAITDSMKIGSGLDALVTDVSLMEEVATLRAHISKEHIIDVEEAPTESKTVQADIPVVSDVAQPLPIPPPAQPQAAPVNMPSAQTGTGTSEEAASPKPAVTSPVIPAAAQPNIDKTVKVFVPGKVDPKAIHRKALVGMHKRSIGDTPQHPIKPYFLQPILNNLPHCTGEPLVDDMVCVAYIHVNSGNYDTAMRIFEVLNQYRDDLPASHIGAGSICAMQRKFDEAITHFNTAVAINPAVADAWKRRGQTRAAQGKIGLATKDLNRAIALQPNEADGYNQRGQVYHQTRNYTRALADFRAAHSKGLATAALLNNIGMCEGQLGRVKESIEAHQKAIKVDPQFKEAHLNIALMHKEIGKWKDALPAFVSAMKVDPTVPFFQAYAHRGLMYAQLGMPAMALKDLTVAINALFTVVVGGGAANTPNASGKPVPSNEEKLVRRGDLVQNLVRAAMCYQTVGQFHKTLGYLDQALSLQLGHNCWFQREIAQFLWASLDVDLVLYNLDDRVDPRLKDGWCKHVSWNEYMVSQMATTNTGKAVTKGASIGSNKHSNAGLYVPQSKPSQVPCLGRYSATIATDADGELLPAETVLSADSTTSSAVTSKLKGKTAEPLAPVQAMRNEAQKLKLVELTLSMRQWVQLDSPGFLPNRRQHRMFGLSVLQMSASLTKHFSLIGLEGIGLAVTDASSSRGRLGTSFTDKEPSISSAKGASSGNGGSSSGGCSSSSRSGSVSPSGKRGAGASTHTFNWRDLYDIGVRWRQVSEPGDPVWWIDRFPRVAFEEGFGLQTPLVNGHLTTVRYAPYYSPALARVKELLQQEGFYTPSDVFVRVTHPESLRAIAAAETLSALRAAVGTDFYVVVPCPSLKNPGAVSMEGTRITLMAQAPEGFDFTIRTPGKPHRWSQYEEELEACFHRLEETFLWMHQHKQVCQGHHSCTADCMASNTSTRSDLDTRNNGRANVLGDAQNLDEVILRPALELFYLWATFAPLSRGTAACGYAALCAVLLAFGRKIATPHLLPAGKQLDWEAILAVDFESFYAHTKGWFTLTAAEELMGEIAHPWCDNNSKVSAVGLVSGGALPVQTEGLFGCVKTLRDMIDVMSLPYKF